MVTIKVAVKEPQKPWFIREVENTLPTFQQIVGGYIEHFADAGDLAFFCNENRKFLDLKFNIKFRDDFIMGTIFAARCDDEGEFVTLTDSDEKWFETLNRLHMPMSTEAK